MVNRWSDAKLGQWQYRRRARPITVTRWSTWMNRVKCRDGPCSSCPLLAPAGASPASAIHIIWAIQQRNHSGEFLRSKLINQLMCLPMAILSYMILSKTKFLRFCISSSLHRKNEQVYMYYGVHQNVNRHETRSSTFKINTWNT